MTFTPDYGSHGKFCTRACFKRKVEKLCPQCGAAFEVKRSRGGRARHCSLSCKLAAGPSYTQTCPTCQTPFTTTRATAVFCSVPCRNEAGRATGTCDYCLQQYTVPRHRMTPKRRCCSNRCATLLRMKEGYEPGWFGQKRRSGYRTDIEAMAEQALIDLKIPYLFEHKIGRYSVDFALPTMGVALECDGWQHVKMAEKDAHRDAFLWREGWRVVRILDKELRTDAKGAIKQRLRREVKRERGARTA